MIYRAFDILAEYWNHDKMRETIVQLTYDCIKSNDNDLLELFKLFMQKGYLDNDENLCCYIQEYVEERFSYISTPMTLTFACFLKDLGLWHWNTNLMQMIQNHFTKSFYLYEFDTLCRLVKIIGYNHLKNTEIIELVEDSIKVRLLNHSTNPVNVQSSSLRELIEGVSVLGISRKRLNV